MRTIAVALSLFLAITLGSNAMAAPKASPVVKINLEVTVFEGGKVEVRHGGPRGGPRAAHPGHEHSGWQKKSNKKGKSWCSRCESAACRGGQCRKATGGPHRPHGDSKGHGKHRAHQRGTHAGPQGAHPHPGGMEKFDSDGDGQFSPSEKKSMKNAWAKMIVARIDKDRDGKLTVDEIPAQMRDKFSKVDSNNDHYIDSKELGAAMAKRMKQMKSGGKANKETKPTNLDRGEMFFKRLDANQDGKVSRQEIPAGRKEMLGKVDANRDGSIDREELRIAMAKRSKQKGPEAKGSKQGRGKVVAKIAEAIMQLDGNSDGRLDADEVAPRLKSKFSDLDKNGDGYLDKREVKQQVKRRMQQERAASELRQPTAEQSAAAGDEAGTVASSSPSGPE